MSGPVEALTAAGWILVERMRGDALAYELLLERAGTLAWATVAPPQRLNARTLEKSLALEVPGVARLERVVAHDPDWSLLVEEVPAGPRAVELPPGQATGTRVGAALARTLRGLHERGLWAGGLRPERVIAPEGGAVVLAPRAEPFVAGARAVSVGIAPLYPDLYLAAERITGFPPSAAADVFALAATVFRLLHGVHPFPDEGPAQARAIMSGAVRTVARPTSLDELLRAALDPSPAQRPSLAELQRTLGT